MRWRFRPDPRLAALIAGPALSLLARSWRIETRAADQWRSLVASGRPFIFLLWHEALLPLLWHHRHQGVAIVVSEATDGRYLAEYARRIGYRLVMGSSTRGGVRALLQAIRSLEAGHSVAFTPDGPRGPRRVIKPGVLRAAERGGAALLPIHAVADRAWRLRSWDRFMIPKPFARVRIGYGTPLTIGPGDDDAASARASTALDELEKGIAWQPAEVMATA